MIKSPSTTANSPPSARVHAGPPGRPVAPLTGFVPAKTHYPFFVMSVVTFMEIDGLLPDHQTMLQRGDLVPHDPETMKDLTMFISHQCTFTTLVLSFGWSLLLTVDPGLLGPLWCALSCKSGSSFVPPTASKPLLSLIISVPRPSVSLLLSPRQQGRATPTQTLRACSSRRSRRS